MEFKSFQDFLYASAVSVVSSDTVLEDACEVMSRDRCRAAKVRSGNEVCGVITESAILRHVTQHGGFRSTRVKDLMWRAG